MKLGFYEGVNLSLAYCEECGYQELEMDKCPKCGSENTEYCLWHKDTVCKKCGHYF